MTRTLAATLLALLVPVLARTLTPAAEPPVCEPGYMLVEETCYRDEVRRHCRLVPDVKKVRKTVYECQEEYFCLPPCRLPAWCGLAEPAGCPTCAEPYRRRLLVKKEVVEEQPSCKWVVETTVEKVPYTVYHKVPCPQPGAHP